MQKDKENKDKKVFKIDALGITKKVSLPVIEEKGPFGKYNLIDARNSGIAKIELIKIANEANMPVLSDYGKIFPEGKTARDYAKK